MYVPDAYQSPSSDVAAVVMARHPFATLVSTDGDRPTATQIPLRFDASRGPNGTLFGHLARANDQGSLLNSDRETLAIFQGPHAYISPTWYAQHPAVPTWHHVTVHAYGRARILTDPEEVRAELRQLVAIYESGPNAWSMDQLPDEYLRRMSGGITAFELTLTRVETQCKLGQKRSETDRSQVIRALRESASRLDRETAAWMESFPQPPSPVIP